jgi:hypothetical protein
LSNACVYPHQRRRLEEIMRNFDDRIEKAHVNGWLGECQGLQIAWTPRGTNSPRSTASPGT